MKKSLLLLSVLSVSSCSLFAQTNPPPSPESTFFNSVQGYFTSFNTNLHTFQDEKGQVWAGADYISGLNVAASLGLRYDCYQSVSVESVTRTAGIAGTILSQQLDAGVSFVVFDTQFTLGAGGGYNLDQGRPFGALFAEVRKALTDHTFAGVRLETDLYPENLRGSNQKPVTPALTLMAGFTF